MLFGYGRRLLSCSFSSSVSTPQQAYDLPHLPTLQNWHFVGYILCMTNHFNFDDFDPDTSIGSSEKSVLWVFIVDH